MTDVDRLAGTTVLTVGDVMVDGYVWGSVGRISPEAPVPIVSVERRTHVAGGAANVATGVVALGGRALLAGVVGDDDAAGILRDALARAGIDSGGLVTDPGRPTTTKTRVIAQAQQVVRLDEEDRAPLGGDAERAIVERALAAVGEADAIVISDYGKGLVTEAVAQAVIGFGRDAGIPVVVDSKGLRFERYRGATVIAPNQKEAAAAANVHIEADEDLHEAARRLSPLCDGAALLVTRGAAGMILFDAAGAPLEIPTRARDVYDVTGAGDTVVATLAVALARDVPLRDAVGLANQAAGIVVGKVGTSTVSLAELAAAVAG